MAYDEAYVVLKSDIQELLIDIETDIQHFIMDMATVTDDDELRTLTGKLYSTNKIKNKMKEVLQSHEY